MRNQLMLRAAALAPTTYDAKTRTIEVVLSTGAAVARYGYVEKLDINGADLRGIVGAPVLDTHNQGSTRAVLGVIEKAWKVDGEIRARLRLSARDDVAGTVRDIAEGIIRNLSIGYSVSRWADSTNSKGERTRTALAWRILEASFCSIGADPGARTRSHPMKTKTKKGAASSAPPQDDVIDDQIIEREEPTVAETRAEIRTIIKRAGGTAEQADDLIDQEATVEQARAAAYEIMTARTSNTPRVRIVGSNEAPQAIMQRRQDALYARVTGAAPKPEEREFYNTRLVDHARAMLAERGVPVVGLSEFDIITRAHTTSDFPELLTGTGNRILLEQFQAAQSPLIQLGRTATAPDFRPLNRLRISEMGALQPLGGENSELKNISRSEIADAYSIESFGGIFALSFKAQQNDDLSAFADFGRAAGQAVAQYQRAVIVDLIEGNPNMGEDNQPLFSAAHNNNMDPSRILTAGGALTPLEDARLAMRIQKGLDGVTPLNLAPKFLVVGAELETEAQRAMSLVYAAQASDVNVFAGSLELLVESALDPVNWFLFANPSAAPVFEHSWLQGFSGPQLASQENFRTLARDYRVVAHWGAGLLPGGWRGAVANFATNDSNS
ncbi:prohead protease/major capsid protein fusion protein [Terricaulis silvestris]|uniref:Caudovirus prohead protease n=1 Tax=Terricaulis silvestris TaxID=2686094 RepID=A0A6I6MIF6_9CAUL|nr:prohead protease/major capsid protein fusion protein [Terricaulis silvestris]QGZ94875.1 Caudovirus prohead protease [Terricaulis silvestris]